MASIASTEGDLVLNSKLEAAGGPVQHRFSPYDWNGGTVVAIAGADYTVVGADTRLATGYSIKSRNIHRALQLTDQTIVACGGCHADVQALYNNLKYKATMFEFDHGAKLSTVATAQLLSNTLYYKRFFPYYALAVVAGLDDEGTGYVAGYDAVGSYLRSRDGYMCNGSGAAIGMPILDNLLGVHGVSSGLKNKPAYSAEQVVEMIKDMFLTIGERDIMCGDSCDIFVITKDGTRTETFELKKD
uniref:Proteasome subunit beta n=1 Tax=Mucochytrium quahogii TaxID=96639 RepID=A0A7S2WRU9_9STRA|mmetsp:Transcript_14738/g.23972  ORF Transcript_14738/g.23972 Transcript_14738/m.23972 type:complete len:244 (-) Transcript_14738:1551-2282(-)